MSAKLAKKRRSPRSNKKSPLLHKMHARELEEHNRQTLQANISGSNAEIAALAAEVVVNSRGPVKWERMDLEIRELKDTLPLINPFNEELTREIEQSIVDDRRKTLKKIVSEKLWSVFRELSNYPLNDVAKAIAEVAEDSAMSFANDQNRKLNELVRETSSRIAAYTTA